MLNRQHALDVVHMPHALGKELWRAFSKTRYGGELSHGQCLRGHLLLPPPQSLPGATTDANLRTHLVLSYAARQTSCTSPRY